MRRAVLSIVLIAAGIGSIPMLLRREPRYEGRSLTSWLQQCDETPLMETQRLADAQQAVRSMPVSRVLPKLLKLVEAKDDPASLWVIAASDKFHLKFLKWHSAEDFQQLGIAGFEAVGTNAASAVKELTGLLQDKKHAFTAVRCLVSLGGPAEMPMCQALTNENPQVRQFAASQLAWVFDSTEAYINHLTNSLDDPDAGVRFAAVQGIGSQTESPDLAIPVLVRTLEKNDGSISSQAASALAGFGTNAINAFPALSNIAVRGTDTPLASVALRTLVAIGPDRALPIVLQNSRSADRRQRHAALMLMCGYPTKTPEMQSAIEHATKDEDSAIAQYAKGFITREYQNEHPDESQFPNEPSYQGKSLGEWLKAHDREGKFSNDAEVALRDMGANAIPALLYRLVYVQPPFGMRAFDINIDAVRGFIVLGNQAVPALPQLQALMDSTNSDVALHAMLAACGTGSNAMPILIKGLTNQFPDVRNQAAQCLTDGPGTQFSQQRKAAIPLLIKLLNDSDESVRMNATNEIKQIDPEAAAKAGIK